VAIVELLLEAGANVNAQGGKFGSALNAARKLGRNEIVQILLEAGAKET
jgi:ankyrin repeat protein